MDNNFIAEKFGSDNASAEQEKIPLQELANTAEETLEDQRMGQAVHEEEGESDLEETEEVFEYDEFGDEIIDHPDYDPDRDRDLSFEESSDPRWYKDEYFLLNEEVDWDAIQSDPKQLFTIGNSKVGMDTIIFNLQPARFCPSLENGMCKIIKPIDGEYKIACYAYQDERQYKTALQLRLRQMRYWDTHTAQEIFEQMANFYTLSKGDTLVKKMLKAPDKIPAKDRVKGGPKVTPAIHSKEKNSVKLQYIRFNQSGDLKDAADAKKMDDVAQLAKEHLGLITYTYTARKDILAEYKFKHVHVQGSGFSAITAINKPAKTKKGITVYGKSFKAYPSIYNKKGKLIDREPGTLYYEDIMEKNRPDGSPNSHYDRWTPKNTGGWFPCKGDCNPCRACKSDDVKLIACKIHRPYQKLSADWHAGVDETPKGYKVRQKFDVYQGEGSDKKWSPEMDKEYADRSIVIQKEKDLNKLPKEEQIEIITNNLHELYSLYDVDMDEESLEKLKTRISNKQKQASKRGINWEEIKKEYRNISAKKTRKSDK